MRRMHRVLLAIGLAAIPNVAVAEDHKPQVEEHHDEWSMSSKGRLGVMIQSLTPELRSYFGADKDRGVIVARVEDKSAAQTAGLAVGDVIVAVKGQPVDDATDVIAALADVPKNDTVAIDVVRDRKPVTLRAKLATDPIPAMKSLRSMRDLPFDHRFPAWFDELLRPLRGRGPTKDT